MFRRHSLPRTFCVATTLAFACALASAANAGTVVAAKGRAHRAAPKPVKKPAPEMIVLDADAEQVKAAELVFYGKYECEFNQTIDIVRDAKHAAYVDLSHGKSRWLMKPVLSSTGAIRLEDVQGQTLMVQISSKSMLLNVKSAQRVVDDCVSARQRELIEAAKAAKAAALVAKAAEEAASAAAAASSAAADSTTVATAGAPPAAAGIATAMAASAPK